MDIIYYQGEAGEINSQLLDHVDCRVTSLGVSGLLQEEGGEVVQGEEHRNCKPALPPG